MDEFEKMDKVERLKSKANVSFEEAKAALEASDWDLLNAFVYLERKGSIPTPEVIFYKTSEERHNESDSQKHTHSEGGFGVILGKIFRWCGKVIKKGNDNFLQIEKIGEKPISLPVTVFVILLFFCFWITIPLMVVGLFFGFRYSFRGPDLERPDVNGFMDKVSDTAENIKNDFKSGYEKDQK